MFPIAATLVLAAALGQPGTVRFREGEIVVTDEQQSIDRNEKTIKRRLFIQGIHFGSARLHAADPLAQRKPTTYYHTHGPVGQAFSAIDPLATIENPFLGDVRLPAQLVAAGAPGSPAPAGLVALWSEPPIAVIGAHTGTLASYAKPYQRFDFYERNPTVAALSLPEKGVPLFPNIKDARDRGALVSVIPGDARPNFDRSAPKGYYRYIFVEMVQRIHLEDVETELITKEGVKALLDALAPDGVVGYHTSNRYLDLSPVILKSAIEHKALDRVVYDTGRYEVDADHFGSAWAFVSRDPVSVKYLGREDANRPTVRWQHRPVDARPVWTDAKPNSLRGVLHDADPDASRQADWVRDWLERWLPRQLPFRRNLSDLVNGVFRWRARLIGQSLHLRDVRSDWLRKTK